MATIIYANFHAGDYHFGYRSPAEEGDVRTMQHPFGDVDAFVDVEFTGEVVPDIAEIDAVVDEVFSTNTIHNFKQLKVAGDGWIFQIMTGKDGYLSSPDDVKSTFRAICSVPRRLRQ